MTERIHDGPIDEDAILLWAYDEELLFNEQDEDLVLGAQHRHFPLLAELAQDPACPKADYCLAIMDFSLMFRVLRKHPDAASVIASTLGHLDEAGRPEVGEFIRVNRLRLELLQGGAIASSARALELGRAALNGISRKADILLTDNGDAWDIELSVPPFHRHKEWLTLVKSSGQYSFKR